MMMVISDTYRNDDVCMWCGQMYCHHISYRDPRDPVPRVPCSMLKSGFVLKRPTIVEMQQPAGPPPAKPEPVDRDTFTSPWYEIGQLITLDVPFRPGEAFYTESTVTIGGKQLFRFVRKRSEVAKHEPGVMTRVTI